MNNNDMYEDTIKRRRWIRLIVIGWIVILLGIVIYVIYVNIMRAGKIETVVKCAPYIAKTYVDGGEVANNSTVYLEAGEHELLCFLPGFEIDDEKVEISEENTGIAVSILAVTSEGEKIARERVQDYYDVEAYVGGTSGKDLYQYSEEDKRLLKFLPYNVDNFGLGMYANNEETIVTITVWKDGYTQMAINKLLDLAKEAGVSLAEYKFRINDFNNQLMDFRDNGETGLEEYIINGYPGLDVKIRGDGEVGNYYYALISVGQPTGGRVVYRALLQRTNGQNWKLVATPQPVLTMPNTPGVPQFVLDEVNNTDIVRQGNT